MDLSPTVELAVSIRLRGRNMRLPARMTVRLKRFAEVAQTQRADRF